MNGAIAAASGWLLTVAVHGALWALLALLLSGALRHRALAWQEALLRASLVAGLLTGSAQWWGGGPALGWPSLRWPAGTAAMTEPAAVGPRPAGLPGLATGSGSSLPAGGLQRPQQARMSADRPDRAAGAAVRFAAVVAVGSAMGMAVLGLASLVAARRRLSQRLASRQPEADPRVLAIAATVARELGLPRTPHLSRSGALASPIAFSLLRPEVCLPQRVAELGDDELCALFGHELAHVRRADAAWLLLGALVHALFPWQAWLVPVRRRLCEVAELRCDAAAAAAAGGVAVANCLVQVAAWVGQQRLPRGALAMAAQPSLLRRRVEHALAGQGQTRLPRALAAAAAVALAALFTAAAPGVRHRESGDAARALRPDLAAAAVPPRFVMPPAAALAAGADRAATAERVGLREQIDGMAQERRRLAEEAAQLREQLVGAGVNQELRRMLDLLEVRLAAMQRAGDRLDAALARMETSGAISPARRTR